MLRRALFAILSLAFATAATAGAKEDLHAAFTKFLAQTSFKGSIDSKMNNRPMHSTVEFQAPDRYRVTTDGRPPGIIIGSTMYMDINGHSMKIPMPVGNTIAQYRNASILEQVERGMSIEDLGMDSVGGLPAHKYRYTVTQPHPSTSTIWVASKSGLPVQLQTSQTMTGKAFETTIRYSNFSDSSIQIKAPN